MVFRSRFVILRIRQRPANIEGEHHEDLAG